MIPCELPIFEMILITCKTMYYQPRFVNFSQKSATILPCAPYAGKEPEMRKTEQTAHRHRNEHH